MFVFPHGARLVTTDEAMANAIPVVTSFVLTAEDKSRMYGACIVWYEELPQAVSVAFLEQQELLPEEGSCPTVVHAPEAICLLSRVPVFEGLMECCRQLFRMRLQARAAIWRHLHPTLTPTASRALTQRCHGALLRRSARVRCPRRRSSRC